MLCWWNEPETLAELRTGDTFSQGRFPKGWAVELGFEGWEDTTFPRTGSFFKTNHASFGECNMLSFVTLY
jgi:hypothetical protein